MFTPALPGNRLSIAPVFLLSTDRTENTVTLLLLPAFVFKKAVAWQRVDQIRNNITTGLLMRLVAGYPLLRPGFESMSGNVGFVVDKVTLE
jgi:hypothetical protein